MQISTKTVQRRYDRIAPLYQAMDRMIDDSQRTELLSAAHGDVLEVGVGTGANLPFYPLGATVIGIDLSSRMLSYAKRRAREARAQVRLLQMDVQPSPSLQTPSTPLSLHACSALYLTQSRAFLKFDAYSNPTASY